MKRKARKKEGRGRRRWKRQGERDNKKIEIVLLFPNGKEKIYPEKMKK